MLGIFDMEATEEHHICLFGKQSSGKSTLARALNNYSLSTQNLPTLPSEIQHSGRKDTIGLMIHHIPFVMNGKSMLLVVDDCGFTTSTLYKHLSHTSLEEHQDYCLYIGVFSMTDAKSLEYIDKFVADRRRNHHSEKFFLVGTHVDQFESYQITDEDLQVFSKQHDTMIYLIDLSSQDKVDSMQLSNFGMQRKHSSSKEDETKQLQRGAIKDILGYIERMIK